MRKFCLTIFILALVNLLFQTVYAQQDPSPPSIVKITVDYSGEEGPLSELFTPSINLGGRGPGSPAELADGALLDTFGEEVGFGGTYRLFLFLDRFISGEIGYENFAPYLERIKKQQGKVIVSLFRLPKDFSANTFDPKDPYTGQVDPDRIYFSRPRDFKQWQEVVYRIMKFFSVDKGFDNLLYEIWNEPDHGGYWTGTEQEYFQLYRYAVKAAKKIEKDFKVDINIGGPATMSWNGYRIGQEAGKDELKKSMMCKFIEYAGKNKLDIDFISWHQYTSDVKYHRRNNVVPTIRGWLKKYGFDYNTPLIIDEWNLWLPDRGEDIWERDNEKGASFIAAHIYNMDKAGLNRQTFFALQDFDIQDYPGNAGLGLFTLYGVKKPAYNVFLMLKKLGKVKLKTTINDDTYIGAIATRDNDKIVLLVFNYVNLYSADLSPAVDYLMSREYTGEKLCSYGINSGEKLRDIITRGAYIEKLKAPQKAKNDLRFAHTLYQKKMETSQNPTRLELAFDNLPFKSKIKYERFLIDADHSNNFKDNLALLKQVKKEAMGEAKSLLSGKGYDRKTISILDLASSDDASQNQQAIDRFKSLPSEVRMDITKASEVYKSGYQKKIYRKTQQAKSSRVLESGLSKIEEELLPGAKTLNRSFSLEPYSVSLIILSPAK